MDWPSTINRILLIQWTLHYVLTVWWKLVYHKLAWYGTNDYLYVINHNETKCITELLHQETHFRVVATTSSNTFEKSQKLNKWMKRITKCWRVRICRRKIHISVSAKSSTDCSCRGLKRAKHDITSQSSTTECTSMQTIEGLCIDAAHTHAHA